MPTFLPYLPSLTVSQVRTPEGLKDLLATIKRQRSDFVNDFVPYVNPQHLKVNNDCIYIPGEFSRDGKVQVIVKIGDVVVRSSNKSLLVTSNVSVLDGDFSAPEFEPLKKVYYARSR